MKPLSRLDWGIVAGATVIALVLRLLLWSSQSIVSVDGTTYIRMAWTLGGGADIPSAHPWGYPFLIYLFHFLVRDWVTAARLVALVTGTALVPLTWFLARSHVTNRWLCLAPALAVALLPLPVRYSITTMSEAPYLVLVLAMFVLAFRKHSIWAGMAGGLAYTVRPEALTAVVALALFSLKAPRRAGVLLAGAALVVIPYVVGQGVLTGTWTLSKKTINVSGADWRENEPRAGESRPVSVGLKERVGAFGKESLAAYPSRFAELGAVLIRHGGWVVTIVAVAGLFGPAAALAAGLAQLLVTPLFALGSYARFVLPFLPFVWVLAAVGVERFPRRSWRWAVGIVCVGGLATTAVRELPAYSLNEDGHFPELVEAGRWLAPYVVSGSVVYDRKPYTAFFAGATYRTIPTGSYDEIMDAIVAEGGDYLVVDQGVVDFFRPQLLPLAIDKAAAWNESRTRPVYVNTKYTDRKTVVYRVVRPGGPAPLPVEKNNAMRRELSQLKHQNTHFFHGILAMRGENWQTAAGEFYYATQSDSTNPVPFNNRAWCLLKAGQALYMAEEDARRAVALDPDNLDYLDTLVQVLMEVGKTEEANVYRSRMEALEAVEEEGKIEGAN